MNRTGTLKGLFKQKSAEREKEKKELKRAATIHRDDPSSVQRDPGPLSPGDGRTLPEDGLLSSPKEKKSKRSFFSLRIKKKKRNNDEEGEGFEELDSFSSRLSYDQMSVSTECSFRPGSESDPQSEQSSVINLDMSQQSSPMSPSKLKGEKKGTFNRIISLFQKKKSTSSRHQSNTSTNSSLPASPISPRLFESHLVDGLKHLTNSPTGSHDSSPRAGCDDSLSQSSSPSVASLIGDDPDLPFADSSSCGRSSVRELNVSRISTVGVQKNSKNVTPTNAELPSATCPYSNTDLGFAESVVEEVSKRLQVNLDNNIQSFSEENVVTPTTPMSVKTPISLTGDTPKSPNLTSISLGSKKTVVKVGEKGHSTALRGITLNSQSFTSCTITSQQEINAPDAQKGRSEVGISSCSQSEEIAAVVWSSPSEREQTARGDSPIQLHKAIWVETYLGDEQEAEGETDVTEQEEEVFRLDSPPVLALPVTVVPEDEVVTQEESASLLSSSSLPESDITVAATWQQFQTSLMQPEEPDTSMIPEPEPLQEKPREIRMTRKTVSLPSKGKVFAKRVFIQSESSLEGDEEDLSSETSSTAEPSGLTSFHKENEAELKDNRTEAPPTTTDGPSKFNTYNTPESIVKEDTMTPAFGDITATSDMSKPKLQDADFGVKSQSSQMASAKEEVKGAADNLHTSTVSGTKISTSAVGVKVKSVSRKISGVTKTETPSDPPPLKERSTEKRVSALPVLKDQSSSSYSKPKIPKVSTSETDVKSPVTPDKISEPDVLESAVMSKLPKQPIPKEPVKCPTKPVRKSSFEEAKSGRSTSGNISPTKSMYKTGTKLIKERSIEECVESVNGMEKEPEQRSSKKGYHPDRESLQQSQQQSSSFLASKSKLPVSSPTRKTNVSVPATSSQGFKKMLPGQTNLDKGEAVQKQSPEQKELTPIDEKPGNETLTKQPGSTKKGTGSMPSLKPSKHLSKRSMSHEESGTASLPSPPIKQEKTVFSRLAKQNENVKQHSKFPVKDLTETSPTASKLPTRSQSGSKKLKSKIQQQSPKFEDSNFNAFKESTVKVKDTVTEEIIKDSECKSAEEHIKITKKQTKTSETTFEEDVTDAEILGIQSGEISISGITDDSQIITHPVTDVDKEIPAQSLVANFNNAETDERKQEAKQPKPEIQKDNKHRQKTLPSFKTSTSAKTKDVLVDLPGQTKSKCTNEKNPTVLVLDIKPTPKDGTIKLVKPELEEGIHYDITTHTSQKGVMSTSETITSRPAELVSEDKFLEADDIHSLTVGSGDVNSEDFLEDQTKAVNNGRTQTLKAEAVKHFDAGEKSKVGVGWKPAEALDVETENFAVCEFPKNVENQSNKEALLGESGRREKDSKPNEMLNHAAVESPESQNSCKEKLKERPVDFAGEGITDSWNTGQLLSEEKSLQPAAKKKRQTVVTNVLKGRRAESEESECVTLKTTVSVTDTKQQIFLQEDSQSVFRNTDKSKQQKKESLGTSKLENNELLTKNEGIRDGYRNVECKDGNVVKEKTSSEISTSDRKLLETEAQEGTKEKEIILNKDQTMNDKTTERNAQSSAESKTRAEDGTIINRERYENHISDNKQKVTRKEEEKSKETQTFPTAAKLSLPITHIEEDKVKTEAKEISEYLGNEIVIANNEDSKQKVQTTVTVPDLDEKLINNQQAQIIIKAGDHDGESSKSEHPKSEITDSSLQSLSNETETPGGISKDSKQQVQTTVTASNQDGKSSERLRPENNNSFIQIIVNETETQDHTYKVCNKQVQKPVTVVDHDGKSTESERVKSDISVLSLQSLVNETEALDHRSKISCQHVQTTITVCKEDGKSTETEGLTSGISQMPRTEAPEATTESQRKQIPMPGFLTHSAEGARDDSKLKDTLSESLVDESVTANTRSDTGNHHEPNSVTERDQEKTKQVDNELVGFAHLGHKSEKQPDTDADVQEKGQDKNDTLDAHSVCSTTEVGYLVNETADNFQMLNTDVKQEREVRKSPEVSKGSNTDLQLGPKTVEEEASKETSQSQIQEVKITTTNGQGDEQAKDKTTSKDQSNEKLVKETVNVNTASKLEIKKDLKPTLNGKSETSVTKPAQEKFKWSEPEKPRKDLQEKQTQSHAIDATQDPDNSLSFNDEKEKTEVQDFSSESLLSDNRVSATPNHRDEVCIKEVQKSKTKDKDEDLPKPVQQSKGANTDLKLSQSTEKIKTPNQTTESQIISLPCLISPSPEGAKDTSDDLKANTFRKLEIINDSESRMLRDQNTNKQKLKIDKPAKSQSQNEKSKHELGTLMTEVGKKTTGRQGHVSPDEPKDDYGAKLKESTLAAAEQVQTSSTSAKQNAGTAPNQVNKSEQRGYPNTDLRDKQESVMTEDSKTEPSEEILTKNIKIYKSGTPEDQGLSAVKDGKVEIKTVIDSKASEDTVAREVQEKTPNVAENMSNLTDAKLEQNVNNTAFVQNLPNKSGCADQKEALCVGSGHVAFGNDALKNVQVFEERTQKPESVTKRPTTGGSLKQEAQETSRKETTQNLHFGNILSPPKEILSAWLNVEDHHKKKKGRRRNEDESASDDELLEPDNIDIFISSVRAGGIPFSLPRKKHFRKKLQSPPFAMPGIKEDHCEWTFDPQEFQFGLRKTGRHMDLSPAMVIKQKAANRDGQTSGSQDNGTSADQLTTHKVDGQDGVKEETQSEAGKTEELNNEPGKITSRLERMSILTGLLSSPLTSRRTRTEASGASNSTVASNQQLDVPLDRPQKATPLPLPVAPADNRAVKGRDQSLITEGGTDAVSESAPSSSSVPPLPAFSEIKLPDHLEKYLKADKRHTEASQDFTQTADLTPPAMDQMSITNISVVDVGQKNPTVLPSTKNDTHDVSQNGLCTTKIKKPVVRGHHRRPGKIIIHEHAQFGGEAYEVYGDVEDSTTMKLSPVISVKVIRGCWLLYEKPGFQGRILALEEGPMEQIVNMWEEEEAPETLDKLGQPIPTTPMVVGSIQLAVRDYSIPRIDLYSEVNGLGRMSTYCDDTPELSSYGIPQTTGSIKVHSGVWLVYSDPGFDGLLGVLLVGEYPHPQSWGFPEPFIGSIRPLRMGAIRVERPTDIKALVFEKPNFEGECLELDGDVYNLLEQQKRDENNTTLCSVGSIKILGGLWVGYQDADFEGQQYILEEGEYPQSSEWGGSEDGLHSLRPILADFQSPNVKLFSEPNFSEHGSHMDLVGPVVSMEDVGRSTKTQSITITGGVLSER
ncbi:uncharacterized protein crybg1a isoform X2 [Girardinichthys multiradiatus]|uniref:uncharacterized protein crybg1a isoform X2 n=1 Tax=Girardinichthys multiradiatus TaxID=208333 RepID=UPI001FAC94AE|nr:uncharacterized protein crybg1a isoform X2 [Girardinichthys multiradiatus]